MEADDRESGSSVTLRALGNGLCRVTSTLLLPQWRTRICKGCCRECVGRGWSRPICERESPSVDARVTWCRCRDLCNRSSTCGADGKSRSFRPTSSSESMLLESSPSCIFPTDAQLALCVRNFVVYIRLSILSVSCSFAHEVVSSICLHTVQP
jgi:hypothetical protein